jgi:hypothetical protein
VDCDIHAGPRRPFSPHANALLTPRGRLELGQLAWLDRGTGRVIRRYEHTHAGSLVQAKVPLIRDFVPRAGLEPATYGLEFAGSARYRTIIIVLLTRYLSSQ